MTYEIGLEKTTLSFIIFIGFICFGVSIYFTLYLKKYNLFSFFLAFISFMFFIISSQAFITGAVFYNTLCFNITHFNSSIGNVSETTGFNCPVYYKDFSLGLLFFLFIILSSLIILFSGLRLFFDF